MVFTSSTFIVFFLVFYPLYLSWQRFRDVRPQNVLLLVASNIFYGAWDARFLGLLWFSTLLDFIVAQRIVAAITPKQKRLWLTFSLTGQLTLLAVFKYLNFGITNLAILLQAIGFQPHLRTLEIILPAGISFYTFQTMAYTIDVYRGKVPACTDLVEFATYVSFFPQLVAGPIETPGHLLPQVQHKRQVTQSGISVGIYRIVVGFFKKVVIADTLAPLVEYTFDPSRSLSGISTLLGVMGFSLQIYGDFAGYTLIARGISNLLGFDLPMNFNRPYLATSPRDFWRRWHISLSSWLRTYLYFSLGGSRKGRGRTYVNLLLTMLLGGLWHGAAWNFVIWGFFHGLLLCADHYCTERNISLRVLPARFQRLNRSFQMVGMYGLTLIGWLFFRVKSLNQATQMLENIVFNFRWTPEVGVLAAPVLTVGVLLMAFHLIQESNNDDLIVLSWHPLVRFGTYTFLIAAVAASGLKPFPFIYFQF